MRFISCSLASLALAAPVSAFHTVGPCSFGRIHIGDDGTRERTRCFLTIGPDGQPATSSEEDLELTRQIILDHVAKTSMMDDEQQHEKPPQKHVEDVASAPAPSVSTPSKSNGRPQNDLMIRAALGETVEKTPLWLFRQAGRHLPEYRAYKDKTGRNFLEMLANPEDVAECTMQPLRRYDLDAAILFSDILVIAEALGIDVTMPGGVGIQVPNPLASPEEVETRIAPTSEMTAEFVEQKLGHVISSVKLIRERMDKENRSIPLIGFSAAPWTLLYYMVGGSSKKNNDIGMKWLQEHPKESTRLLDTLTKIVIEYMSAQVDAGAHMLQVFEAMGMMIDEENFFKFAMPCLEKIADELKKRHPDVPLMVFSRGASFANEALSKVAYDVITIDGSVSRNEARNMVGGRATLQGNYDPRELIADGTKTPETVRQTARELLEALGPQHLIANLGEGLGGKESPELVDAFVNAIHEESEAMIKRAAAQV